MRQKIPKTWLSGALLAFLLAAAFPYLNPYMWTASLAYALLMVGLAWRKRSRLTHACLMSLGMSLDVALVLVLEFKRDAIAVALAFSLSPWQQSHIAVSTLAVLLYVPIFALGWKRLRDPASTPSLRTWHIRFGYAGFFLRTLGFLLMFSMLGLQR